MRSFIRRISFFDRERLIKLITFAERQRYRSNNRPRNKQRTRAKYNVHPDGFISPAINARPYSIYVYFNILFELPARDFAALDSASYYHNTFYYAEGEERRPRSPADFGGRFSPPPRKIRLGTLLIVIAFAPRPYTLKQ